MADHAQHPRANHTRDTLTRESPRQHGIQVVLCADSDGGHVLRAGSQARALRQGATTGDILGAAGVDDAGGVRAGRSEDVDIR